MACKFIGELLTCDQVCEKYDDALGKNTYTPCINTYKVFLTRDGDTPVRLRFEAAEDPLISDGWFLSLHDWVWVEE